MKYSDLIDFKPIESVIKLRDADAHDKARRLVETFVISGRMAEQWTEFILPNLQYDRPADTKGILIVGNYGTGKSHWMSFISALGEHDDLANVAHSQAVLKSAQAIAGKFKVIRTEIGSTTMSLRDIITGELQDHLAALGINYTFPSSQQVRNNKDALHAMMGKFHERFPRHGLLMVVDELLDYLRTRNDQELPLDLNFLREVGEVCSGLKFRFIAGLQETLFDNPRFQVVADSVRRVKDRFAQLRIIREDVAFVVSERLLRKTAEQQARIRTHLEKFTPLYDSMAERLDEFVRLFPVHPAYLEQFEQITVAEKREVLKTVSVEMRNLLEQEVPRDEPGLISYDSFWRHLCEDASVRAEPDLRQVIDRSNVVASRIKASLRRQTYVPMALRICHGLSVHRLTTRDIDAKVGPTASELRDGLCLFHPALPEKNSDFLRTTVESCLGEIVKTLDGQFITHNKENDQFYLDLKKNIDYDAKIEAQAASLSPGEIDRYYFDALQRVLECGDTTCVTGYRIWEHEVEWQEHKVTRRGYLFFGAANERPTTQPPRDFYIYFRQPFQPPVCADDKLPDEVYLVLRQPDAEFERVLRLFAGAKAMASQAGSGTRKSYQNKADLHLKTLAHWLRQHMLTTFDVVHRGVSQRVVEFLAGHKTGNLTVRELVNLVGSVGLGPCFKERYPKYPTFSITLTTSNLRQAVADAVHYVLGGPPTKTGTAVLEGLELLAGDNLRSCESRYAKSLVNQLAVKPQGHVLNRHEILAEKSDGIEIEMAHQLEPDLLVVVLLSLVHRGEIAVGLAGGKKIDAANLSELGKTLLEEFCSFKHIERPKDISLSSLVALFELVGLPEALIRNPDTRDEAVRQLHEVTGRLVKRAVVAKQVADLGVLYWGQGLIPVEKREEYRQQLNALQAFLEQLQVYNSPGKLQNFSAAVEEIKGQAANLESLGELEGISRDVAELTPLTSYLSTAKAVLAAGDPWVDRADTVREESYAALRTPKERCNSRLRQKIAASLERCKKAYQSHYLALHHKTRLGIEENERKNNLLQDARLQRLQKLTSISLLPQAILTDMQDQLAHLKPCFTLVEGDLETHPICPHCGFRPNDERATPSCTAILDAVDEGIDRLLDTWEDVLLNNLSDPTVGERIMRLPMDQNMALRELLAEKTLPAEISNELLQGLQSALFGLTPIRVKTADLLSSLGDRSAPCTVGQFRARFEDFLAEMMRGNDISTARILIESGDTKAGW